MQMQGNEKKTGEVDIFLLQTRKGRMKFTILFRVKSIHTTITNVTMCQMKKLTKVWNRDSI